MTDIWSSIAMPKFWKRQAVIESPQAQSAVTEPITDRFSFFSHYCAHVFVKASYTIVRMFV